MSVGLEEYMDSLEVKPDGFKLTLVYWGREPSDNCPSATYVVGNAKTSI